MAAASAAAGAGAYEEMLRVVEACAVRIRWRLRPGSKRRLLNDILFLCTGLRPVVLVDYGGTMPQLQENLCSLLHHAQQLLTDIEANDTVLELVSIQERFSAKYPVDTAVDMHVIQAGISKQMQGLPERTIDVECTDNHVDNRTLLVVDLSAFLETAQIALPSLNGWLLGYPVTYLFRNESAEAAIQNLSKHSLHIYRVYVCGSCQSGAKQSEEELMSFSVPCCVSMKRDEEPWAKSFIARMSEKLRRCNQVWASIRLEVEVFQSQSQVIVL
ncbi:unnamed protein product [Urochloa decumbens]|uniref:Uncharacterized protein n=1 Tax=Urochloa decumbens TaxID=240449 RepID=A0ABC9G6G8_9POAL